MENVFLSIIYNPILLISVMASIISQFFKMALYSLKKRKLIFDVIWKGYGNKAGMPSSHTAFMSAAAATIYLIEGGPTNLFMLSVITAIVTVQTVVDLKFHFDSASNYINGMFDLVLDTKETALKKFEHLTGHTYNQVIVGAIIGIYTAINLYPLF